MPKAFIFGEVFSAFASLITCFFVMMSLLAPGEFLVKATSAGTTGISLIDTYLKKKKKKKGKKGKFEEIKRTGAIKRDSCANFLARFNFGREEAAFHPKRVVRSN